jgi:hypothetical protein
MKESIKVNRMTWSPASLKKGHRGLGPGVLQTAEDPVPD